MANLKVAKIPMEVHWSGEEAGYVVLKKLGAWNAGSVSHAGSDKIA